MKDPIEAELALKEAEDTCFARVVELLGLTSGVDAFISTNGGRTDCAVFDIGSPWTGDCFAFPAVAFHWRATLDLYSRSRKQIQRWIMRLCMNMPIAPWQGQADDLRHVSTVDTFRIVPEPNCIEPITTTELVFKPVKTKDGAEEKKVEVFTTKITFDVVFKISRD